MGGLCSKGAADNLEIDIIEDAHKQGEAVPLKEEEQKELDHCLSVAYEQGRWDMQYRCLLCQMLPWKPINLGSNRVVCADCLAMVAGKEVMGFNFPTGKTYVAADVEEYEKKVEKMKHSSDVKRHDMMVTEQPCLTFDYKDLPHASKSEEVGVGGVWGQVFLGKMADGKTVAAKYVVCAMEDKDHQTFKDHAALLAKIKHPNFAFFYGAHTNTPDHFCLVYKYYSAGSIESFLHEKNHRFTIPLLITTLNEIAKAMHYLHCCGQFHGDLRPCNVLFNHNFDVNVIDWGMHDIKRRARKTYGTLGSAQYMSPERLQCQKHDARFDDVYAFGIMACEMYTADRPFQGMASHEAITTAVFFKQRPVIPDNCFPSFARMMRECWSVDPKDRPSFFSILRKMMPVVRGECVSESGKEAKAFVAGSGSNSPALSTSDVTVEEKSIQNPQRGVKPTVVRTMADLPQGMTIQHGLRFVANLFVDEYVTYKVYVDINIYGVVYYDAVSKKSQGQHSWAHISAFTLKKDKFVYEWKPLPGFSQKFVFDAGAASQALFDRANELMSYLQKGLIERRKREKSQKATAVSVDTAKPAAEDAM